MRINIKPLGLLMLSFLISAVVHAQMISDIVYLKNGTVIKGMIVEQVPGKTIKVRTADNLLIEINYQDIARIVKEETFAKEQDRTRLRVNNGLKKYYFKFNGGFFTGDALGYIVGGAIGLRLGHFSVAFTLNKSIADDKLTAGATGERYDRLNVVNYTGKGFYALRKEGLLNPYFGLGVGYGSSPHTGGKGKTEGSHFGYYDAFLINPSVGLDIPVGRNIFLFTELNYNWYRWGNIHGYTGNGEQPFKHAQIVYLITGVKF